MKSPRQLNWNALGLLSLAIIVTVGAGCGKTKSSTPASTPANNNNNTNNPNYINEPWNDPNYRDSNFRTNNPYADTNNGNQDAYDNTDDSDQFAQDGLADFNPYESFNNDQGEWFEVDGTKYFQPRVEEDWQPYQNGSWTYDVRFGMTWVSQDSFGAITDHYGVWRNYRNRWVWMPFERMIYRPHCVTWFNDGDYVGWYPYYTGYTKAYRHGFNQGFTDGFWEGFKAARQMQKYRIGVTIVNREFVASKNLKVVIRQNRMHDDVRIKIVSRGFQEDRIRNRQVGKFPGGDRERSFRFIQNHAHDKLERGETNVVKDGKERIVRAPGDRQEPRRRKNREERQREDDSKQDQTQTRERRQNQRREERKTNGKDEVVKPADDQADKRRERRQREEQVTTQPDTATEQREEKRKKNRNGRIQQEEQQQSETQPETREDKRKKRNDNVKKQEQVDQTTQGAQEEDGKKKKKRKQE